MASRKEIDLNLEIDVITREGLAHIVNAILEFLLYQRNQIEFVYKTFKVFINEWLSSAGDKSSGSESVSGYMQDREREKAIQTKVSISAMHDLITNAFQKHMVTSLRFIFGSTTFTPKEVYTIHIPSSISSAFHLHDHVCHPIPNMRLNQLFISLLTTEDLYTVFSKNLSPTNLYLEMEILENKNDPVAKSLSRVFPKEIGRLPSSCKDIHFHLRHKLPFGFDKTVLNCCKELKIFEDLLNMQNSIGKPTNKQISLDELITGWWEADIIVRGFKEKMIKGRSIWTK